ncbi:MAG TPA: hypothetical protein PKW55_07030 [Spirochaetota bacterium]|nr:hypothetical protein [Spirochaetota bacterium]HOM38731.1 hypothetical protein [Spirochaetota bacterium]HPQ49528.1 hypothetical protein [Spirochaetota bacterium]
MELLNTIELTLESLGYKLVDFKVKSGKVLKYEITIYSDNGISHNDCKIVTDALMGDENIDKMLGEDYVLEVGSPGVGRKLKKIREFKVFLNKEIDYCLLNSNPSSGIIKGVNNSKVIIYDIKDNLERELSLEEIQYAKLKDIGG